MRQSHGSIRKDSVQREAELDLSEDLLVRPVRGRKVVSTEVEDAVREISPSLNYKLPYMA